MTTTSRRRVSRRSLLKTAGLATLGAAAGSGAITGFPTIWAQNIKNVTIRQFGTGVSNLNAIADKVKQDLGFTLQMTALDTDAVTQKAVTQPHSYDVADIEYFAIKKVFPTGVMQPMDTKKIKLFDKIVPIFTTGKLTPTSVVAQGTAPNTVAFVDGKAGTKFAPHPTEWTTLIPTIYNADTLGIRPDLVGRPISHWKDLVDPAFKGKAAILTIPGIGIMDAAMVMELLGTMKYVDKGNMTKPEIDKTDRLPDRDQEGRPVPRLLEELRRERQPDGLGRGDHPVDVVAGGRGRAVERHCLQIPAAGGRLSRLGRRAGPGEAPERAGTRCRLRIHQLVSVRLGRRLSEPPGLLQRGAGDGEEVHDPRRMGLLDGGQAGAGTTSSARRAR